jgi:hypothetical protein
MSIIPFALFGGTIKGSISCQDPSVKREVLSIIKQKSGITPESMAIISTKADVVNVVSSCEARLKVKGKIKTLNFYVSPTKKEGSVEVKFRGSKLISKKMNQ